MKISKRLQASELAAASDVVELCNTAKQLEDSGEYAAAARAMGGWWQGIGVRPDVDYLPADRKAAVLSRVGALSGWLGSMQQVPGSQEKAKDLISEAASSFEEISDHPNWAEARSDLAVCYWREGAFSEAKIVLQDILGSDFIFPPELLGKILLRSVSVEISTKHFDHASVLVNKAFSVIEEKANPLLQGKLYFYRAFTLRSLGEDQNNHNLLLSAVRDYKHAGFYYKKAKHDIYAAAAESNAGNVYRLLKDYRNAHSRFDQAIYLYTNLKDQVHAAQVYENKARAFLAESKLEDAETAARASVDLMLYGDEKSILAESLTTLAIVLNRVGNIDKAISTFKEAKETALMVGDKESAGNAVLTYIEELQPSLTPVVFRSLYLEADELLENSPKHSNINRLQNIARKYFETVNPVSVLKKEKYFDWQNFSLPDAIHSYERELILKALREVGGRITKAAKLLGVTHQSLSQILRQRHNDLIQFSIQRRPRGSVKDKNYSE
jgi:tetratricopeptide (TPR) repeat protein